MVTVTHGVNPQIISLLYLYPYKVCSFECRIFTLYIKSQTIVANLYIVLVVLIERMIHTINCSASCGAWPIKKLSRIFS